MKKLNIHYLEHVPFEGLGCIGQWITERGHNLSATKFHEQGQLPQIDALDWLIIMGGPMSVNDYRMYPWLESEKEFIAQAIVHGKTVIGICLGSQLIASALGSCVFPNTEKEIGWFPIQNNGLYDNILLGASEQPMVFHWHGDTFKLPQGARLLASSRGCENQAFLYRGNVLGLQFHLEATKDSIAEMLIHGRDELVGGKYIQTASDILEQDTLIIQNNRRMYGLLNYLEAL